MVSRPRARTAAGRHHVPCLVLTFEHDIDSPPQHAPRRGRHHSGARFAEIPGSSHLAPYTHPVPVVDAIIEFLASTGSEDKAG